ncbi:haloacid dehalogenase-like hydrolase [Olivibacter sp. SA151]|uniref:HAD family hydrolase n=1 Tax=Olivibacter jilunii TaxID=985016 RepID=UPI003F5CCBDD
MMLVVNKIKKALFIWGFSFLFTFSFAQTYRPIHGWTDQVNQKLESFLNSTLIIKERKVAVFDCDGTLFGQSPYYLADEAIYAFAKENYAKKVDSLSKAKMAIIDAMLHGDNVGVNYVKNRIAFLAGLTPDAVKAIGKNCFYEKYRSKFYPEMRELLANLQHYGFEIWVLSASPELLYQQFVKENLGIPEERILGVKSVVSHGRVTNQLVCPIPQDGGKAEAIQTFIKARPLLVGGNSRGDLEMMNESVGIKLIVNPDDEKIEKGIHAGDMDGYTVKQYWEAHDALTVYCHDADDTKSTYITKEWGIPPNKSHPKIKH